MSEIKTSLDTEPLQVMPSQEAIGDPNTAWHAIRGYDFAGLEAMLDEGLLPAENQQDHSVSLSVSPNLAWSTSREANSFFAYTMQDGISLAIQQDSPQYPTGNHGGFVDEIRKPYVPSSAISGLMLPDTAVGLPLTEVSTNHEPRKPLKAQQHLERTIQHIEEIGGTVDEELMAIVAPALESTRAGNTLVRGEATSNIEQALMSAYSKAITETQGIPNPTVGDAIKLVLDRLGKKPEVFFYTEEQKKAISLENAKLSVKNQSRTLGSLGVASYFSHDGYDGFSHRF